MRRKLFKKKIPGLQTARTLVEFPSLPLELDRCRCRGLESSSRGVRTGYGQGQGAGVVFEGCQDRIRSGSRSWSRLRGVSGQDTIWVKVRARVVFDVGMSSRGAAAAVEWSDGVGSG